MIRIFATRISYSLAGWQARYNYKPMAKLIPRYVGGLRPPRDFPLLGDSVPPVPIYHGGRSPPKNPLMGDFVPHTSFTKTHTLT